MFRGEVGKEEKEEEERTCDLVHGQVSDGLGEGGVVQDAEVAQELQPMPQAASLFTFRQVER